MIVTKPRRAGEPIRFEHTKPFYVVDDLGTLTGPATGTLNLPLIIDRRPEPQRFDLADRAAVREVYRLVLQEGTAAEQAALLNRGLLVERWAEVRLMPLWLRREWENVHLALRD